MMNWNAICTVYFKELKDSLRDKRTLITTIVIPTLVIPVLMFGAGFVMKKVITKAKNETTTVMIVGGNDSPALVEAIKANEDFRVVETTEDFKDKISDKEIRVAVDIPVGFDTALAAGEMPDVTIYHYQGEMKSGIGRGQVSGFLVDYRSGVVEESFKERGLPMSLAKPFTVKSENVAPPEKVGGNAIGGFVPYIIVILCFTGAMYPAMDLTAGEKERGTMETLLCSPLNRVNIVMGKFLMTFTASIATMILSLTTLGISAMVAGQMLAGGAGAAEAAGVAGAGGSGAPAVLIDPMGLVGVFAMILPVAVLFSAILLTVSLFAKSFKEAQSYVSPGMIIIIVPAMLGMLPGIDLNMSTVFVPILNLSLVCKEMLSGVWNWEYIALIFTSSGVYAAIALWLCVKMFNREDVIFRA